MDSKEFIKKINWKEKVPQIDELGADLIGKMLELDPRKRISAAEALEHEFLQFD